MSLDAGTLQATLELKDDFTPTLTMVSKQLDSVGKDMGKMGDNASKLGRDMLPVSAGLIAAGGASVLMATNFEASMTRLVSIAGVTSGQFDMVRESILKMSTETGVGPQMLADAMTKVSSTTDNTTQALEILQVAAEGTKAGFGETVGVAGALTAVVNSYAQSNLSAARAGDIMAMTIKLGGAEAKELAPTLANVVPFAAQMGISFEEVGANLATLTKLGVPTAEAVTQLSSVMTAMSKETKQGGEALESVGLSYEKVRQSIREKGLMSTLVELDGKFKGNITGLTDVFGRIEALRNVMGTAGVQGEIYADSLDQIKHSSDLGKEALKNMSDMMNGTAIQSFAQLRAQIEVLAIRIGDALLPSFKAMLDAALPIIQWLMDAVKWFGELPGPVQTAAFIVGGFIAAAGPALILLGTGLTAAGAGLTALGSAASFANGLLFTFGNTVPVLTARIWLMEAASKAAAIGAELMAGAFGMVLTGLGIVALLVALGAALWEVGKAIKAAYDWWQQGKPMWDFFAQKDEDNFVRRWLGLSSGVKDAGKQVAAAVPPLTSFADELKRANTEMDKSGSPAGPVAQTSEQLKKLKEAQEALEKKGKEYHDLELKIFNENNEFAKQAVKDYDAQAKAAREYYNNVGIQLMEISDRTKDYKEALKSTMDLSSMMVPFKVPVSMEKPGELAGDSFGKGMKESLTKTMSQVPDILVKGLTGGGGLTGAFSAIGSMVGSGVGQQLGEKLGKSISSIASFAGPLGSAIGAMAGPMIEMFTKMLDSTAKGVKKTAEGYGVEVSEALVESIKKSMKELDMGQQAATILNADKMFPKVDAENFADALRVVHDAFSMVATGQFTVAQGAKVVDDMWSKLADVGTDSFGRISDEMKELIALNEQYGTQSKEIAKFLGEQATAAGDAFTAISKGSQQAYDAIDENRQGIKDLIKEIDDLKKKHEEASAAGKITASDELEFTTTLAAKYAEMTPLMEQQKILTEQYGAELENTGMIAVATYGAAIAAGKSHLEALQLVAPGMKDLQEAYHTLGLGIEDAGLKSLMMGSIILEENPYLIEAVNGLGSSMVALDNMGQMNADTFTRMQTTGMTMYTRLQAAVVEHGGAAQDALMPMQDYLHQAEEQAKKLGVPLDANTQMLIDQSKELGVWKEAGKTANELLLDGISELNKTMKSLVDNISGIGSGLRGIPSRVTSDVIVTTYNRTGQVDEEGNPIPMAEGGFGTTTRPTLFMTSEDGRPEQFAFSGQGKKFDTGNTTPSGSSDSSSGLSGDPATVSLLESMDRAMRDLPRAINIAMKDALVNV